MNKLQISKMRDAGYILAVTVAKKLGVATQTAVAWSAAKGKDPLWFAGKRWLHIPAIVDHIGAEQAQIFGLCVPSAPLASQRPPPKRTPSTLTAYRERRSRGMCGYCETPALPDRCMCRKHFRLAKNAQGTRYFREHA